MEIPFRLITPSPSTSSLLNWLLASFASTPKAERALWNSFQVTLPIRVMSIRKYSCQHIRNGWTGKGSNQNSPRSEIESLVIAWKVYKVWAVTYPVTDLFSPFGFVFFVPSWFIGGLRKAQNCHLNYREDSTRVGYRMILCNTYHSE